MNWMLCLMLKLELVLLKVQREIQTSRGSGARWNYCQVFSLETLPSINRVDVSRQISEHGQSQWLGTFRSHADPVVLKLMHWYIRHAWKFCGIYWSLIATCSFGRWTRYCHWRGDYSSSELPRPVHCKWCGELYPSSDAIRKGWIQCQHIVGSWGAPS